MAQKRNFTTVVIVILVIAVAILSFTVAQSGITSLGGTVSSTPTIVAPLDKQLGWDCPGAATCGGGG